MKSNLTTANGDSQKDMLTSFLKGAHMLLVLCQDGCQKDGSAALRIAGELRIDARRVSLPHLNDEVESAKMGTRLYVCGDWSFVNDLEGALHGFGVTDEEIFISFSGSSRPPVFCASCYHKNQPLQGLYIYCEKCGRMLEVSNHYSKKLDAVLGYLVLPEQLTAAERAQTQSINAEG